MCVLKKNMAYDSISGRNVSRNQMIQIMAIIEQGYAHSYERDFSLGDQAGDEFVSGDVSTSSLHVLHHFFGSVVKNDVFHVLVDVEKDVSVDGRTRHHRSPFHRLHVLGAVLKDCVRQMRLGYGGVGGKMGRDGEEHVIHVAFHL